MFRFTLPITKVDKAARTITGVATGEWKDSHGEIVDYAAAKAAFGTWPGNIREMHQPIAVGKAVDIAFDDESKAITVTSKISKGAEDTWQKILDGTLGCYSIGAQGTKKVEKRGETTGPVIYVESMVELSVVDVGALPGSEFAIVKSVDGKPTIVAAVDDPDPPAPVAFTAKSLMAVLLEAMSAQRPVTKAALPTVEAITKLADPDKVLVLKHIESYDIENATAALYWLQRLCESEYYDTVYPAGDADSDQSRAQLDLLRAAAKLVLAFIVSEFEAQFAALDAESTEAIALFRTAVESEAVRKAIGEMPASFSAIDPTGRLVFIGKAGARHSKADVVMIQAMHDTAISLGAGCATVEKSAPEATIAQVKDFIIAKMAGEVSDGERADMVAIVEAITPVHGTPVEKAIAVDSPPTGLTVADVQKMIETAHQGTVEKVASLESTIAEQRATIEKQQGQLNEFAKELAASPVPGGPVTRVAPGTTLVDKSIGTTAAPAAGDLTPEAMTKAIEKLGSDATPAQRQALAELLIKVQHATGHGARAIVAHPASPAAQ